VVFVVSWDLFICLLGREVLDNRQISTTTTLKCLGNRFLQKAKELAVVELKKKD